MTPVFSDEASNQISAADVVAALVAADLTIAAAESLTGGLVAAAPTSVAGSSACFRGGIVSYATDLKVDLLGVDPDLLLRVGPVDADVARQMARGVASACGSDIGVSTTGVAGQPQQNGVEVGTVFVAVCSPPKRGTVQKFAFVGDREHIRAQTVGALYDDGVGRTVK